MKDKVRSQSEKIKMILSKLDKQKEVEKIPKEVMEESKTQKKTNQQTVSDDFDANKEKENEIYLQEEIIRRALSMFDISYDDLIRMDGKSAYCRAVEFYPHLLEDVRKSDCPPLYALAISKSMKPFLEFTEKYGESLDQIKHNLKEELKKEMKDSSKTMQKESENVANPKQASIFSDIGSAIKENKKMKTNQTDDDNLASFFIN